MDILAQLDTYALYAVAVVGSLTLIVRGFSELAKLTKTDRDDDILNYVSKALETAGNLLDKIAVDPKKKDPE